MPDNTTGAIVALLPAASDPIVTASSEPAHITLAWFGEAADVAVDLEQLEREVAEYAASASGPITAMVDSRGTLGDDEADVVFVSGDSLVAYREGLVDLPTVGEAVAAVEQYPKWTPHVTLGYPETPANGEYDGESVTFDRVALWIGTDAKEFALGGEAQEDVDEEDIPDEEMVAGLEEFAGDPVPWHGVLAPTGVESGDYRMFVQNALTWRELPLPLKWQKVSDDGHKNDFIIGNITEIEERDGLIMASGFFAQTPEATGAIELMAQNMLRWVSVDVDMAVSEFATRSGEVLKDGDPIPPDDDPIIQRMISGRIAGATMLPIPAFQEATLDIGTWEDLAKSECEDCEEKVAAAGEIEEFAPGTKDGPGWITHPVPTNRIREYWVRGKGAAKIRWGVPGDFNRCRKQLAKYIQNPEWLAGACANMHKEAIRFWPGQEAANEEEITMTESAPAFTMVEVEDDGLVAAIVTPPRSWFEDPKFDGPTPLTILENGQVFGHVATWGTCHTGLGCSVKVPRSSTNYAHFNTGAVQTDEGLVSVGHITMKTGHADLTLSASATAAHYDNTAMVAADVHAGEDAHGIWVAGMLRPGLSDEDVHALRASAISGDWRRIGAGMEMIAALAVNSPGFPVPRLGLAASGTLDTALVAAAIVMPEQELEAELVEFNVKGLAKELVREFNAEKSRQERRASVRASLEPFQRSRRDAVLAKVTEE